MGTWQDGIFYKIHGEAYAYDNALCLGDHLSHPTRRGTVDRPAGLTGGSSQASPGSQRALITRGAAITSQQRVRTSSEGTPPSVIRRRAGISSTQGASGLGSPAPRVRAGWDLQRPGCERAGISSTQGASGLGSPAPRVRAGSILLHSECERAGISSTQGASGLGSPAPRVRAGSILLHPGCERDQVPPVGPAGPVAPPVPVGPVGPAAPVVVPVAAVVPVPVGPVAAVGPVGLAGAFFGGGAG